MPAVWGGRAVPATKSRSLIGDTVVAAMWFGSYAWLGWRGLVVAASCTVVSGGISLYNRHKYSR